MQVEGQRGVAILWRRPAEGCVTREQLARIWEITGGNAAEYPITTEAAWPLFERHVGYGWARGTLASWSGNGTPRLRCLGVLRGRSPTLELRHGPNSYGRQQ